MMQAIPGGAMGWILLILVSLAAIFILQRVVVRRVTNEAQTERVLKDGKPAKAVVLDTYDTGNRINVIYILIRLRIRVEAIDSLQPFDAELTVPISPVKLAEFASGRSISVRVDPVTREVAVDQARR